MNQDKLLHEVCQLARETGTFIREEIYKFSRKDVETKDHNSFVTYVDKESEKRLVYALSRMLPGSVFITEEGTVDQNPGEFTWIIDPLDGTTNFIHRLPVYAISIALVRDLEPLLGVVYEINNSECFYAQEGGHAYLNGTPIRVSSTPSLEASLMATGFPYYDYSRMESYLRVLQEYMQNTRGIRRMGSAATDLAYVACGRFDGFFEYGLHPWDVAAGAFLVKQAGGLVGTFNGKNNYLFGKEIVAANPFIYEKMIATMNEFFG
ncbi:MAG: inositol monophosphatase [Bacteroidetes bacterium]|nr:inositol monophosphatase [Bacteroidota bacterium]